MGKIVSAERLWAVNIPQQGWQTSTALGTDQRDSVVGFWLSAPMDQLEALWNGGFGVLTRQMVQQLTEQTAFTPDQVALRQALNQRLGELGLSQPLAHQLLLAAFLLSPPGLLKVADAERQLPAWLAAAYKQMYETAKPVMTLGGDARPQAPALSINSAALPNPDFGAFPLSLEALVGNRIQLNRLLGLSNLYYIDPEDQEICEELLQFRRSLAGLIKSAPEQDLERIWATDFGDRYWALVRSGVQKEALAAPDQQIKDSATSQLNSNAGGGFDRPGAICALLVAMMYYAPGSMRVEAPEKKIPGWLLPFYRQVFDEVQASAV